MSSVAMRRPFITTPIRKQVPSMTNRMTSFLPAFFARSFALSAGSLSGFHATPLFAKPSLISARSYSVFASKYLDPKNDLAFKRIFGTEKHKSIPIDFLNATLNLNGLDKIVDLEFLNPIQTPEIDSKKTSIVDVLVRDQRGIQYIVEMQVAKVEGFEKRAQYYAAKTYCAHFGKGGKYKDLKRVVFLAITDYTMFPNKSEYKSDHVILDTNTHENDLKDFSFTFVELPKFTKTLEELETIEDRWYFFLKHADESANIQEILSKHPEIKEAYEVLDRSHWSESDLFWYEKSFLDTADLFGALDAAKSDGIKEGKVEGVKEGILEGEKKKTHEFALKLLKKGTPIQEISELIDLTPEEIENIRPK